MTYFHLFLKGCSFHNTYPVSWLILPEADESPPSYMQLDPISHDQVLGRSNELI